jgi:hypothetical protein
LACDIFDVGEIVCLLLIVLSFKRLVPQKSVSISLRFIFQLTRILAIRQSSQRANMAWEQIAADKRARIAASIPPEWRLKSEPTEDSVMDYPKKSGILSADELAITDSSAVDLVARMAAGELTSVAVTTAFCKRAALAHHLVCI